MSKTNKLPDNKPSVKNADNGGFWIPLMAVLGFIFGSYMLYKDMNGMSSAKGIYVIDGERLAYSYIAQADSQRNSLINSSTVDDAAYQNKMKQIENDLANNLQKISSHIKQMSSSGMVVIQRSSVLSYPPEADMTEKVAAELGITLAPAQPAANLPAEAAHTIPNNLPASPKQVSAPTGEGAELD